MRVERRLLEGFDEQPHTRARGRVGEQAAIGILLDLGYEILERNFHVRGGELDVVAMEDDVLCFVEIKVRSSDEFGSSLEAVDDRKRRRMIKAATVYMVLNDLIEPICRFDVLGLDRGDEGWEATLVRDAFTVDGLF